MPPLTRIETEIRELHEDDTAVECRLDELAQRTLQLRQRIVADGRLDRRDTADLLEILDLVPAVRADAAKSLRFNWQINGRYCELAKERRHWALAGSREQVLEEAA
jgi:hypothetical protein